MVFLAFGSIGCLDLVNCSHLVKNVAIEKYQTMKDLQDPPSLECSAEVLGLEEKCLSSGLQASLQFPKTVLDVQLVTEASLNGHENHAAAEFSPQSGHGNAASPH